MKLNETLVFLLSKLKPVGRYSAAENDFKKRKLEKEQQIKVCDEL